MKLRKGANYRWSGYILGRPPKQLPEITITDQLLLAKLVAKYGLDAVERALPKRKRGRPSRGALPIYEKMHLAEWIDDCAEEYREAGYKAPLRQARIDAYHMETGSEQEPSEVQIATIKDKHLEGRKAWQDYRAAGGAFHAPLKNSKTKGRS